MTKQVVLEWNLVVMLLWSQWTGLVSWDHYCPVVQLDDVGVRVESSVVTEAILPRLPFYTTRWCLFAPAVRELYCIGLSS